MKKQVISFLLIVLVALGVTLPALAVETVGNAEPPAAIHAAAKAAVNTGGGTEDEAKPDAADSEEPEPSSFVYLDGVPQTVEYEIINGTTYVTVSSFVAMVDPQAVVVEEDGVVTVSSARVEQIADSEENTEDVVLETLSMTVSTQVPYIVANDRYLYARDSVITVNERVAAPIRKLALVFNLDVGYDAEAHAALLTRVQDRGAYIESGDSYYDATALYWLSHIIFAESGNQVLEGKIAVGNVVMNRVDSSEFPNTIYDVLHQKNQFSPVISGSINKTPSDAAVVAAKLVMDGAEVLPTALFFARAGLECYASRNRPYVATIGAHAFYA